MEVSLLSTPSFKVGDIIQVNDYCLDSELCLPLFRYGIVNHIFNTGIGDLGPRYLVIEYLLPKSSIAADVFICEKSASLVEDKETQVLVLMSR